MYSGWFEYNTMNSLHENIKIYHNNGKIEFEGFMKNGLYEGYGRLYRKTGKILKTGNFSEGLQNGDNCTIYYPSGLRHYQGGMKLGRPMGFGKYYCQKTGKLKSCGEHNFALFKESKLRVEYFANGQIRNIGDFNSANELKTSTSYSYDKYGFYDDKKTNYVNQGQLTKDCYRQDDINPI